MSNNLPAPPVSIIVPVYDVEEYLEECLDSCIRQTFSNVEIIVIDDASPDNSWEIIRRYANADSRIIPIRHRENKHLGGARNTGIEAARGEWLLFLDSDDYLAENTMERFLTKAGEYPDVELFVAGFTSVTSQNEFIVLYLSFAGNKAKQPVIHS